MTTGTVDDWLADPAPPPRPLARKAPARPAAPKPDLRPVDALAAELDAPDVAAGPAPRPGDGLDPPEADNPAPPPPSRPERPRGEIWKGCPVRPLGVNGAFSFYLDVHGQMRAVAKHDAQAIMHLFGSQIPKLCFSFPQFDKDGNRKAGRFDQTAAAMVMIAACSERGLFDPDGAVRGVGAWRDDDGRLVYHTGDRLLIGDQDQEPATHQGRIYPAYPPIPHPALSVDPGRGPAPDVLAQLATWNWERPEIDPMLMLGVIGVQMLGGALDWRPTTWLTGPRAAGKSSLQKLIEYLHGPKGLVQSSDATKSGITSRLGHSSLPVALDELEPGDEGSGKEKAIIDLARIASSGGQWFRGTSDQRGASGNVYSAFLFSSILIPGALNAADLSRLIILSLQAFPEGTPTPPPLRAETWRRRGAAMKRVLIDRWPSWADRLELWREAFGRQGIGGRNGDNWATVLAMADMAQSADLPGADLLDGWAAKVARHIKADLGEIGTDADALITHLLSHRHEHRRGSPGYTIAQWLMVAAALPHGPNIFGSDSGGWSPRADDVLEADAKRANEELAYLGMRVYGVGDKAALFIANTKVDGLRQLFERTPWANGTWKQSAMRIKGARKADKTPTLAGTTTRGTWIPLTSLPGLLAVVADTDARSEAVSRAQMPPDMEDFA